jgi:histone deacetylase complex regulatory component SIN3
MEKTALQLHDLKTIKEIHANKSWNEVALKNFYKALDLKGFEYKKNEKERMKGTYFITELAERTKML